MEEDEVKLGGGGCFFGSFFLRQRNEHILLFLFEKETPAHKNNKSHKAHTNKGTDRPMSSDAFLLRSTIMFFCPYYLHRGQKRNLGKLVFQRMLVNEPSVEISSIMLVIST